MENRGSPTGSGAGSGAGSGHEDEPPSRKRRGNRSAMDWATLTNFQLLAYPGWENERQPWTRMTCGRYIDWAHINRHWDQERYAIHVRSGAVNINMCRHAAFKKRLLEVTLALWGRVTTKDGGLTQCQMAYAEVFLGKDVDWTTFVAKKRGTQAPNRLRHIPPNPAVALGQSIPPIRNKPLRNVAADPGAAQPAQGVPIIDWSNIPQPPHQIEVRDVAMDVEQPVLLGANEADPVVVPAVVHTPDPPQQETVFLNTTGGVTATATELQTLRALVSSLRAEKDEATRLHATELEVARARTNELSNENARLAALNAEIVFNARRSSTDDTPPLDDVVASASYAADDSVAGPSSASPFVIRHRSLLPPPNNQGGITFDAMRARAEEAEAEIRRTKANMEQLTESMCALALRSKAAEDNVVVLATRNEELLINLNECRARLAETPQREEMLLSMSNMKLACSMALNEAEQVQQELKRVAAEFNDGGQRYFGLTSWPRVEEMFPNTLPTYDANSSIDWNSDASLEFQYNTARYRYAAEGHVGAHPLLWPSVPDFVKDGTTCVMCQEPFGPEGGWSLGTCPHLYHPGCLISHMMTRKRCVFCKAPFHSRLYKMFGLEAHQPEHYEHNEDNLPGPANRAHWGKDMVWLWKWSHDLRHLPARTVSDIQWENDADLTEVIKRLIPAAGERGRRLYIAQMAGGHWDVDGEAFVRAPHPDGILFNSEGEPTGIAGQMSFEDEMRITEDNTFHECALLQSIFGILHDRYDAQTAELLRTLQSNEELQRFLRNSIAEAVARRRGEQNALV